MNVLYLLERPPGEGEVFILREIREAARQGAVVRAAYPSRGGYRLEQAEGILHGASPAGSDGPLRTFLPPLSSPAAVLQALRLSPEGALRARDHARGEGRGLGSGLRQAVSLAAEAFRLGADVLHAHFADRACEDAMLASWISGVPFTFTAHGYDVHVRPPSDYRARGAAAAAVVTVSEANAKILRERHLIPASKIRVIPCGVDTDRFRPEGEPQPGLIVSVIRLHRDKGPDILLDAAERLLARGIDFRLEILGDGEERPAIEARLAGPLGSRVRLAGRAGEEEVVRTLRRASLFVLPSRTEGMPVALMEAMACARPSVGPDVGGVAELLDGGRCGVLVPPCDGALMADAIASLLADDGRRRSLGEAARERVVQRFRLDGSVAALRALWKEASSRPSAGAGRGV